MHIYKNLQLKNNLSTCSCRNWAPARRSWRDSATAISERLRLDNFPRESFSQGLPPWCSGEGVTLHRPRFLVGFFGRSQSSIPAFCCNRSLVPPTSNRCRALDRQVRNARRRCWDRIRHLHQQPVVHLRSTSGRP